MPGAVETAPGNFVIVFSDTEKRADNRRKICAIRPEHSRKSRPPKNVLSCPLVGYPISSRFCNPLLAVLILTGIAAVCPAAELPADAPIRGRTEAYLRERVEIWKERLKLQGWSVSLVMSRQSDLRPGTLGNIHWDADKKTAVIRVLGSSDSHELPATEALRAMEDTIVHELIHLELASLPKTDTSRSDEEFAVNHLAEALLELDRKTQPAH